MIKAALLDFDGTLVTQDILSYISDIVGKREESEKINREFWQGKNTGVIGLVERINLLKGVSIAQIEEKLQKESFLMQGTIELLDFLHSHNIVTILSSGNIPPVLEFYKNKLGIDYVRGSPVEVKDGVIIGIQEEDFPPQDFKLAFSQKILEDLHIKTDEVVAIGDSPGDIPKFLFSKLRIAINPQEGVESYVDYTIENDLRQAIPIIQKYLDQEN